MSIYNLKATSHTGEEIDFSVYKSKVLLVVNTATGCGFTPQYEGLQKLYEEFSTHGFEILDFPCNQFGNQAPGTDEEIASFCTLNYNTTFPRFKKIDVNGENEHPVYTYLKTQSKGLFGSKIKWNFTKFLIDRNGNVVKRFSPTVTPEKIEAEIKSLL